MSIEVIGWDIGGAHIKAAGLDKNGSVVKMIQRECPLWKGLSLLNENIKGIVTALEGAVAQHAVTMTGELVDLFNDRSEGVAAILGEVSRELVPAKTYIFAGRNGFVPAEEISRKDYHAVASANWLASGLWVAERIESGLLIDVGTTTTDLLLIEKNRVLTRGYTDYERMRYDELVYTGIVRTPVMAIADCVPFEGDTVGVMAEHFATMADVYRLTGELPEYADQLPAPDSGDKSRPGSARRLARMIGCDFNTTDHSKWSRLAHHLRAKQLAKIELACDKQLSRSSIDNQCLIGAGVGRFLVEDLASRFEDAYIDFNTLFPGHSNEAFVPADCAPAVSVAGLLRQNSCS